MEVQRRRETEVIKLRKDLESANVQMESVEQQTRKKNMAIISELQLEIEAFQKNKAKYFYILVKFMFLK